MRWIPSVGLGTWFTGSADCVRGFVTFGDDGFGASAHRVADIFSDRFWGVVARHVEIGQTA